MTPRLQKIIDAFALADEEMRLELLLDYARKLPPLPDRYCEEREKGFNRVPECLTPVFLWVEREEDRLRLFIDVAEEAPTVKGLLSILYHAYDNASASEFAQMPEDLLGRLQLTGSIRMQRAVGLAGILQQLKREARSAAADAGALPAARSQA